MKQTDSGKKMFNLDTSKNLEVQKCYTLPKQKNTLIQQKIQENQQKIRLQQEHKNQKLSNPPTISYQQDPQQKGQERMQDIQIKNNSSVNEAKKDEDYNKQKNIVFENKDFQEEQSKMHQINSNISNLSASVYSLNVEYNDLRNSEIQLLKGLKKSSIVKQDPKVKQFLKQKKIQKQQRAAKIKNDLSQALRKKQLLIEKPSLEKLQNRKRIYSQLRSQTSSMTRNIKQRRFEEKLKQSEINEKVASKYLAQTPLFQIKEKQFNQKQLNEKKNMQEIIQKRKNVYNAPLDLQEIEQHQKWYSEIAAKQKKEKQEERKTAINQILEKNMQAKEVYKSKASLLLANQQKQKEEKKKVPFLAKQKIKDYQQYVKSNHMPSVSKQKHSRINSSSLQMKSKRINQSNLSYQEVKRYRYMKGFAYGQVTQSRPIAKTKEQEKYIGQVYLQYVRSLPKKNPSHCKSNSFQIPLPQNPKSNPLSHKRKPKPVVHLSQEPTRDQIGMILSQLKIFDKKIKQREQTAKMSRNRQQDYVTGTTRKQINEDLLFSVQKKLNLLHQLESNNNQKH